ncbi:trypsin-like peptidase domain-containing protein [Micromonospora sp. U21]|uniref:trypsin-like peptidase domain-containing protein n=1 Tax=Micromonospora sp. U21 TaxID=2824899 RepID=UPI001B36922C|nr:trypsin-like peptidase domain-containing protein [Micromonospora sp. U21]MBQ0900515.1 trypsin-like peptidase domain-containing protein [Micromonospora sp. U21]
MQSVGPYRFTHMLGTCPAGKAWAAVDGQGRFVTIAVLDAAAVNTPGWREAFAGTATGLSQAPDGLAFEYADFSAAEPWVAYPAEAGPGAERLFRALGQEYQPVPTNPGPVPPRPVSSVPSSAPPVSAVPHPVSGVPDAVSGPPAPTSGVPVSAVPQPTSGVPHAPWALYGDPVVLPPVAADPGLDQDAEPADGAAREPDPVPVPQPAPVTAPTLAPDPFAAPVRRIQPSPPSKRRTGSWVLVVALVLVLVGAGGGVAAWTMSGGDDPSRAPSPTIGDGAGFPTASPSNPVFRPWTQFAPYSPQERALAVASPSLVFLEAVFTGYLRDSATNKPLRSRPISFNRRCSGFLVTSTGHVLTSASCVKPTEESARQVALDAVARMLVREKKLTAAQVQGYVTTNLGKTRFTGVDSGTEPGVQLFGQLNTARSNAPEGPAIPGQVVAASAADGSNVALVKLSRDKLPAAELGPGELATGSSLLVVGFSTDDVDTRTATYVPRAKAVAITDAGRRGPATIYRINGDVGRVSHGGVVLDPGGRVVGMVDQDQARPDRANRVVVPSAALSTLLADAGVRNELSDTDRLYRSGLDAYFAGDPSTAVTRLDAVAGAVPANLLAQVYRQNAAERQRLEGTPQKRSAEVTPLLAGSLGALLVGLVVLTFVLVRRRRG